MVGEDPGFERDRIDAYIRSLPYLPVEPANVVEGPPAAAQRDGDYQCTTENLRETRQYDRIVAYAANSDSLWPGALVSADSVLTGLFTQVVLPRNPQTISVSLENLQGSKQAAIPEPSLASYRDALAGILQSEITGSTPANIYSEIEQVHSEQQLNMALGIQASWGLGVASLKTSFSFNDTKIRSRYVVRYTQAYYTVDLDAPTSPSELFRADVDLGDVQQVMDETRPPAYVSSITYGRMVVFTFESEYSAEELGAALDFAYSGGAVDVSGQVSVTYKDIISKSKITAFILGGDAASAVKSIDSYEKLIAFIKAGGNYTRESPGAPIAYKLNYLKDNSPARMSFTTDYDLRTCTRVSQRVRVILQSIAVDDAGGDAGDDLELYGDITVRGASGPVSLFHKNSNNYVTIRQGNQFGPGISEAIVDVVPANGNAIVMSAHLYDYDPLSPNDDIGNESVTAPFETGWRKDVTIHLTGDGARVRVVLSLSPI
ncbi:MAG: thiol-activated cytolysin family protein [Deltaproteobacteria bacterium]|nr:thiol-activated cytolysin family protein [Deltaproteobacteria bacterium]MCW5802778.1 thiol-activated cytolysin family protein [Deltaproteobacteria bacterium]